MTHRQCVWFRSHHGSAFDTLYYIGTAASDDGSNVFRSMIVRLQRRVRALEAGRGVHQVGLGELGDFGTGVLAARLPQLFLSLRGDAVQHQRQQVDQHVDASSGWVCGGQLAQFVWTRTCRCRRAWPHTPIFS